MRYVSRRELSDKKVIAPSGPLWAPEGKINMRYLFPRRGPEGPEGPGGGSVQHLKVQYALCAYWLCQETRIPLPLWGKSKAGEIGFADPGEGAPKEQPLAYIARDRDALWLILPKGAALRNICPKGPQRAESRQYMPKGLKGTSFRHRSAPQRGERILVGFADPAP